MSKREPIAELIAELVDRVGERAVVDVAVDLLGGADRSAYAAELPFLTGLSADHTASWPDYWSRAWGARTLLYVWDGSAAGAVVAGVEDEAWRVAEMCLKVATRRELAECGDAAARLTGHELPRVRAQAVRLLGVAGDTEHVDAVAAAADDPDEGVRRAAARAYERLATRLDLELQPGRMER